MGPITDAHKLTYKMNMQLAVQQKRSRLEMAFTYQDELSGRIAQFVELYGTTSALVDIGRKADTPDIDSPVEPVWITPRQLVWGKLMEKEDAIKAVMNPQSSFIQAGAASMVRGKDNILSAAVFGSRRIGQDGATISAWAGQTVTVGVGASATDDTTPTGMNVRKILRARRLLQANQVDLDSEQLFLALNAQGIEELYRDLTFISSDYRDKHVLDQPVALGTVGEHILNVTILPAIDGDAAFANFDGSTYTAGLWCKSGMYWGEFDPLTSDIPLRPDKLNRPHPFSEQWLGASRSEDIKVVKILNKI